MPAPNLGPSADLAVRLANLEDQVRRLQQNPLGQAFSATQSDGSVGLQVYQDPTTGSLNWVLYQGPNSTRDPNTGLHPIMAYLGQLFSGGVPVDSGVLFNRPNGVQSAVIGNRGVQIFDAKHNQVFATDEYASGSFGEGLQEPSIPIPLPVPVAVLSWPKTNTSGTLAESSFRAQHSHVFYSGFGYCDAGTTGTVQVVIQDSTGATVATGTSYAMSNAAVQGFGETLALPAGFFSAGYTMKVNASASGGGNTYAQLVAAYGTSS